mmetsp:Transcript_19126/g.60171  ORF Transcript_19126/g.60171 Transcript_19126/m.60171 type:complete len:130 (-) Transcript_19126:178-567(-)
MITRSASGIRPTLAQATPQPSASPKPVLVERVVERGDACLKEKLEGIVSSVHHVLGALNLQDVQPPPQFQVGGQLVLRRHVAEADGQGALELRLRAGLAAAARAARGPLWESGRADGRRQWGAVAAASG